MKLPQAAQEPNGDDKQVCQQLRIDSDVDDINMHDSLGTESPGRG